MEFLVWAHQGSEAHNKCPWNWGWQYFPRNFFEMLAPLCRQLLYMQQANFSEDRALCDASLQLAARGSGSLEGTNLVAVLCPWSRGFSDFKLPLRKDHWPRGHGKVRLQRSNLGAGSIKPLNLCWCAHFAGHGFWVVFRLSLGVCHSETSPIY